MDMAGNDPGISTSWLPYYTKSSHTTESRRYPTEPQNTQINQKRAKDTSSTTMSMTVNRPLLMGAGAAALLALLANVVAMATPSWVAGLLHVQGGDIWINNGMWTSCVMRVGDTTSFTCVSNLKIHGGKIDTVRAMAILGMLCGLVTLIVAGALLFAQRVAGVGMRMPDLSMQRNAGMVSGAIGALCMLICIAIYAWDFVQTYGPLTIYLGYSYYMGVCAMLLHIVGSVLIRFSVVGAAAGGVVMAPGGGVATHQGAVISTNQGVVNPAGPV